MVKISTKTTDGTGVASMGIGLVSGFYKITATYDNITVNMHTCNSYHTG